MDSLWNSQHSSNLVYLTVGIGVKQFYKHQTQTLKASNKLVKHDKNTYCPFPSEYANSDFFFAAWASTLYPGRNERRKEGSKGKEGRKAGEKEGRRRERKEAGWKERRQSVNGYSYSHHVYKTYYYDY